MFLIQILYLALILILLIPASVSDLKNRIVNNIYPVLMVIAGLIVTGCRFAFDRNAYVFLFALLGAFTGFAFTAIPALRGAMGGADVKITAAIGIGAGMTGTMIFLLVSFISASFFYLIRQVVNKIRTGAPFCLKSRLPLVPFMIPGIIAVLIISII